MIRLVIFDLDGTLLDTIKDLGNACNHVLTKYGLAEHSLDEYRFFVGNGISKLVERSLPEDKRYGEFIEKLRSEFVNYYVRHAEEHTKPYDGIVDMLKELENREIKIAVASNKFDSATQSLVGRYFGGVNFSAVYGQREGIMPKPDPTIIFDIMADSDIDDKSAILYVGDSDTDMMTAINAGLESIGVTWGFRPREELLASGANHLIDTPAQIIDIVDSKAL